jgi:hypothetical protein
MSDRRTKDPDADEPSHYAVGHCKPPLHTQFQKGQSGNPRGRSRAQSARRARALALEEAYRLVTVREGNKVMRLPAIQAMMRNQLALAVKGNGPAQRAMLAAIDALEKETRGRGCGRGTGRGRAGPDQLPRWRAPDRVPFQGSLQGNGEATAGQARRSDCGTAGCRDAKDGK